MSIEILDIKPKAVIFDLDGTLVDSSEVVTDAYFSGMVKLGYKPKERDFIKTLMGRSTYETGRGLGIEEKDLDKIDKHFWEYFGSYAQRLEGSPNVFSGVRELLELLKKNNIKIGICTSNERKSAKLLMEKADLDSFITAYVGSEDPTDTKPSPEPVFLLLSKLEEEIAQSDNPKQDYWFVGDTIYDIEAGNKSGVTSIGIAQDHTIDLLMGGAPDFVTDSIQDLTSILVNSWVNSN